MVDLVFSKNQRAVQEVARDLILRRDGDRLLTSVQYQKLIDVGSGTLQRALRAIEGVGGVRLRSRGHQGTFLITKSIGRLWLIAGLEPIRGSLPLASSMEVAGLATGLGEALDAIGVPLQFRYRQGAAARFDALRDGRADFALMSRAAADTLRVAGGWRTIELWPNSYYSRGSVVVVQRATAADVARPRVGVDVNSHDHETLTRTRFTPAASYRFVPCPYPAIPAALVQGDIDLAVWHRTSVPIPLEALGIDVEPFESSDLLDRLSLAVLVLRGGAAPAAVLESLDLEAVKATALDVLSSEMMPAY